jgi:hypothetical protein
MMVDPMLQALHHKSALGGTLTPEEQTRLQQWYAKLDEEEAAMFAKTMTPLEDLNKLRKQVDDVLAQIVATAQKMRAQEAENERLRMEIEALKRMLAQKMTAQPA